MKLLPLLIFVWINVFGFSQNQAIAPSVLNANQQGGDTMELVWVSPNLTQQVRKNEKLELGIKFSEKIDNQILNFTAKKNGVKLNPFNPEDIDVSAEFYWKEKGNWIKKKTKYGFYYQDFARVTSNPDPNLWKWKRIPTKYNFRIRMTPENTGEWKCLVSIKIKNTAIQQNSSFQFVCMESKLDGFIRVSKKNSRYFEMNKKTFFPVGHNVTGPSSYVIKDLDGNITSDPYNCNNIDFLGAEGYAWQPRKKEGVPMRPYAYDVYQKQLTTLKNNGGNYFRMMIMPWTFALEFEKLGDYNNRMHCAWEMDRLLQFIEPKGLKMYLTITYGLELAKVGEDYGAGLWNWPENLGNSDDLDSGYCYKKELGLKEPIEFMTDLRAKKQFKNLLRYYISRYGYSTGIGLMELINESNLKFGIQKDRDTLSSYIMNSWLIEMNDFIKTELSHTNQLIAVNHGDHSTTDEFEIAKVSPGYKASSTDVTTHSYYREPDNRIKLHQKVKHHIESYPGKPFLFSELGAGPGECKNFIEERKDLWIAPFAGNAGCGFNWHDQWVDSTHWNQYSYLNSFLEGIELIEFTQAPQYDYRKDKLAELYCLMNKDRMVIGIIANNTWNCWTSGTGSYCQNDSNYYQGFDNDLKILKEVKPAKFGNKLSISKMGSFVQYEIEWFDVLNENKKIGESVTKKSSLFGELKLNFPVLQNERQLIGFKVKRKN